MPPDPATAKTIKSGREFCALYFPKRHAARGVRCYPKREGYPKRWAATHHDDAAFRETSIRVI
jgi:hypothetical protein